MLEKSNIIVVDINESTIIQTGHYPSFADKYHLQTEPPSGKNLEIQTTRIQYN